jgi:hypothetical protein
MWNFSEAYSVDSRGDVFGTANGTFNGVAGTFAVEWSAVPEPGSGIFLSAAAGFLFLRRGKQKMIWSRTYKFAETRIDPVPLPIAPRADVWAVDRPAKLNSLFSILG